MRELGIYIHIPFCVRKCYYCDFYSLPAQEETIEKYIKYLKQEIKEVGEGIQEEIKQQEKEQAYIKTVYIGGGTPSSIDSSYIADIMHILQNNYTILPEAEITIEVNPGTVTKEKLEEYKNVGINRLSIGMQTTNNNTLKNIGRIHSWEDFLTCYELARKVGFTNINIDCMIGLPNQTKEEIEENMERVISLEPEHISVYSLIVEEGTKLEEMLAKRTIFLPKEEVEREMYWYVKRKLEEEGYQHYEISNFAKSGFESKHNLDCWHQKEYLGFGVAAHSYTDGCRYSNVANINEYIQNYELGKQEDNIIIHEKQDKTAMAKEFILLSLRTIEGCNKQDFYKKFGYELEKGFAQELKKLTEEKLLKNDGDYILLTDKGIDLANLVWEEFV